MSNIKLSDVVDLINSRFDSQDGKISEVRSEVADNRKEFNEFRKTFSDVVRKPDCTDCKSRFIDRKWVAGIILGATGIVGVLGILLMRLQDVHDYLDRIGPIPTIH